MQMTVTNVTNFTKATPFTINIIEVGGAGLPPDVVGSTKKYPLPYPFMHVGPLAPGASVTLPVHPTDFQFKAVPWLPLEPSREWQMMIGAGLVTVTFVAGGNIVEDTAFAVLAP